MKSYGGAILIALVFFLIVLIICMIATDIANGTKDNDRFETIENLGGNYWLVEDKNTGVLYIKYEDYCQFGISPLYNADGSIATR